MKLNKKGKTENEFKENYTFSALDALEDLDGAELNDLLNAPTN
tara:strand:- start:878 stop:1006 length:129 start_codon:yes stop_codon:yes gene_type:complete